MAVTKTITDADGNRMLQMPQVPSSLTKPEDRAAYIAERFWDNMDFADSTLLADKTFMEQQFANFIFMLTLSNDSIRNNSVKICLTKARGTSIHAYDTILKLADDYLATPWSPDYNDELYLPFMDFAARQNDSYAIVAKSRHENLLKNRLGTAPADFIFTQRDGKERKLSDLLGKGVSTLLILYDPTCDDCHELIRKIVTNQTISRNISNGKLNVVAIYAGEDIDEWRRDAKTFHPDWTVGYDSSRKIEEEELYSIIYTPSTYLINGQGIITLKNPNDEKLIEALNDCQ